MEFIPLELTSEKGKKSKKALEKIIKKSEDEPQVNEILPKKKSLRKIIRKSVKNQYKEKILEKRVQKNLIKKNKKLMKKKKTNEDKDSDKTLDETNELATDTMNETEGDDSSDENNDAEDDEKNEVDEEEEKREKRKMEKWKQMDEKKKNRLFVKMKKKIHSESEIKELHPEIRGVIFPRKKNSRWCWAVFVSQEAANKAFLDLVKNKEIFVGKPNTREQVEMKRQKKMATIKLKEQARKKHLNMWT